MDLHFLVYWPLKAHYNACHIPTAHQEQFGVQYLAQGDLNHRPSNSLYLLSDRLPKIIHTIGVELFIFVNIKWLLSHNVCFTDLHPGIEGVEQGEGVSLVAVQGLAGSGAVWVVLGAAEERWLDAEGCCYCQHGLLQPKQRAQHQHLPWMNEWMNEWVDILFCIIISTEREQVWTDAVKSCVGILTYDHIHRQLCQ